MADDPDDAVLADGYLAGRNGAGRCAGAAGAL
jgi:hypothetical protein